MGKGDEPSSEKITSRGDERQWVDAGGDNRSVFSVAKVHNLQPSMPNPLPAGPVFLLDTERVAVRISWMEFQGGRGDSVPIEPDVIEITLWPS